jgi:hypothetical protein
VGGRAGGPDKSVGRGQKGGDAGTHGGGLRRLSLAVAFGIMTEMGSIGITGFGRATRMVDDGEKRGEAVDVGDGKAGGGTNAGVDRRFVESDPVLEGRSCTSGERGGEIVIEKMILVFGEDGGALIVEMPYADDGAIAEVFVVVFLCAVDQLIV